MELKAIKIILCVLVVTVVSEEESNETLSIQTETRIIPVLAKLNRPKTYERIMVLPEPAEKESHIVRPVTEHGVESNVKRRKQKTKYSVDIPEPPLKQKRAPKNYDDGKGNYRKSVSYSKRTDNNRLPHDANRIQPLHINTGVFIKKSPSQSGVAKPTKEQKDRLKLENLPPNPKEVPETSWFDNVGKYNYGILHSDGLTATPEYTATQPTTRAEARSMESKESAIEILPPKATFKSSFRDPKQLNEPLLKHDNKLGAFLYKTEVHYPSYRNHLYPPVVTYGTHHMDVPTTKELPTIHVHKNPPPPPSTKHDAATKKPVETKQSQTDDGDDYDEEEEDSSEDYEDGASNDKYDGEPPGDQEDEGEDDEEESDDGESDESNNRPKYRFSFDEGDKSGSYELDEFDKAWAKFGYGPPKRDNTRDNSGSAEESSYESSETRVKPVRVKFYHEKKEEVTTGHKSKTSTTTEEPPSPPPPPRWPIRKMVKTVSGNINNNPRTKKQIPRKPIAVQPQADDEPQQPGPDDLKYFQDLFIERKSPLEIEFGHISETPRGWEERFERQNHDQKAPRNQGKVRWADKQGGFGEHYWDLNH